MEHLILHLEAPLISFGGETIDNLGVIRRFPAASMVTGLLANALGWRRTEKTRHQRLQDRLLFASRIDREPWGGVPVKDFQTVQLHAKESGWTTKGFPEGRGGGPQTFKAPHLRYRDYWADMGITIAVRLSPEAEEPGLKDLIHALIHPARPLFIGRQPCLPTAPVFVSSLEGETCLAALLNTPIDQDPEVQGKVSLFWPEGEGVEECPPDRTYRLTDERNWISGLHGGARTVCEGTLSRKVFPRHEVQAHG